MPNFQHLNTLSTLCLVLSQSIIPLTRSSIDTFLKTFIESWSYSLNSFSIMEFDERSTDDLVNSALPPSSPLFCVMQFAEDKVWVKVEQPCSYIDFETLGNYFIIGFSKLLTEPLSFLTA